MIYVLNQCKYFQSYKLRQTHPDLFQKEIPQDSNLYCNSSKYPKLNLHTIVCFLFNAFSVYIMSYIKFLKKHVELLYKFS